MTILTRKISAQPPLAGVSVKQVDYSSIESLIDAVRGQDAVVDSTFSETDAEGPCNLIEACIAAGVYRYIPPEFGSDPLNPDVQALPFFRRKATAFKYLLEKVKGTNLTWTAVASGPFFDPPLKDGSLGIDVRKKMATIFGDGQRVSPWSTLEAVGKATAQVLLKPAETTNRVAYISNVNLSQVGILKLAKEERGEEGWQTEVEDIQQSYDEANNKLQQGQMDASVIFAMLKYSLTSEVYTYAWEKDDNALLEVQQFTDDDVKLIVRQIANNDN